MIVLFFVLLYRGGIWGWGGRGCCKVIWGVCGYVYYVVGSRVGVLFRCFGFYFVVLFLELVLVLCLGEFWREVLFVEVRLRCVGCF